MIGYFGTIIFETSDQRILTFTGFKRDTAARFATHELIARKSVTEFTGPGLGSITFTIALNGNYGVSPREEMALWREKAENGEAEYLVIGGALIGRKTKWVVKSVSESWDTILNGGELFSGKIDVALEEYLSETG